MFKLDLEKAEEQEIKLPMSIGLSYGPNKPWGQTHVHEWRRSFLPLGKHGDCITTKWCIITKKQEENNTIVQRTISTILITNICVCVLSHIQLFAAPWTVTRQAPLSMGFPRQECWSRLPFPTPGDLPNPGIEPHLQHLLHWQVDTLSLSHQGSQITNLFFTDSKDCQPFHQGRCAKKHNPVMTIRFIFEEILNILYWASLGFSVKESAYQAGDQGVIPGMGRSPEEGSGNPLQYSFWKISQTE